MGFAKVWSYELIFHHPDRSKNICGAPKRKRGMAPVPMTETSVTVAAESGELALDYAARELRTNDDYELVAVVRRHPIVAFLKEKSKES